jgi:TM2 domain-containing membrane protein YozV
MKPLLFFAAIFFSSNILFAQDAIIFLNGNEVQAKVTEVTVNEVKYHRFDNPNGPLYTVSKKDIFMIKYENGTKDVINDLSIKQPVPQSASSTQQKITTDKYRSPGLAFLFSFLMPGGGQYYNHQYVKGGVMTGLWAAGIVTTAVGVSQDVDCYYDINGNWTCRYYDDGSNPAAAVGGITIFGSWLWSVIDAPINAAQINRANNLTGLLHFEKKDKFSLRIDPFRSAGLGGSLTMRF